MGVRLRWRTILVRLLVYAAAQLCARKSRPESVEETNMRTNIVVGTERIKERLGFDAARLWKRWYAARASIQSNADENARLADLLTLEVHTPVSPQEAGRAEAVLCANNETMAVEFVRKWLLTNAIAELLEHGIDGNVAIDVLDPFERAEMDVACGFITVVVDEWRLRILYNRGCRDGLEDIVLPGDSTSTPYDGWDPLDEMRQDARDRLESMMVR